MGFTDKGRFKSVNNQINDYRAIRSRVPEGAALYTVLERDIVFNRDDRQSIYPDALPVLEYFKSRSKPVSIIGCASQDEIDRDVSRHEIGKYLSNWVGCGGSSDKSDYLRLMKYNFGKVMFVGCSENDMDAANGLEIVGVMLRRVEQAEKDSAGEKASFVIRSLYDLRDIADSI